MKSRSIILAIGLALALCAIPFRHEIRKILVSTVQTSNGKKTIADRIYEFGEPVRSRLTPRFKEIGVVYPPKHIVLVGLKEEGLLEVWVGDGKSGNNRYLKTYPMKARSGVLGPKLAEGDMQIPEGLYAIESLNPNSAYHLALRVNYPNAFDQAKGKLDGRVDLGSDIMIHGNSVSIGCLAMGDEAAEDLFILAAKTGIENIDVILSPVDLRTRDLPTAMLKVPAWTPELYAQIKQALARLSPR